MKEYIVQAIAQETIDSFDAHNAPELVRCMDCTWWERKNESSYGYCNACKHGYHSSNWEIGIYRLYKEDFFCADEERKDS